MVDEHFPKVRDYFHETAEEYLTRRRIETGGFKWTTTRLSIKFLHHLAVYEMQQIAVKGNDYSLTIKEAYDVYEKHCLIDDNSMWDFPRMNVRNYLAAAAYRGVLVRDAPGEYHFKASSAWHYCFTLREGFRKDLPVTHEEFLQGIEEGRFDDPR